MKKRIFSAALAGCMMLTMVPVTAFAAEEEAAVYAAETAVEKGTIECAMPGDTNVFLGGKTASDFLDNRTGKVKLVKDYTAFNSVVAADRSGYYLPLVVYVPGSTENTQFVVIKGHSNPEGDTITKEDKPITMANDGTVDGTDPVKGRYVNLATQIARMDGEVKNNKITVEVWLDGIGGNGKTEPDYTMEYDYSDVQLEDSAVYKTAELKIDTGSTSLFGKTPADLYDVRSKTVKLVTDYTSFSSVAEERSGYYLPLKLDLDVCNDMVVTVTKGKNEDGTDKTEDVDVHDGVLNLSCRIAGTDGKLLRDAVKVVAYPQGKGEGMPSKTYTYDLTGLTLEGGLEIGAVPVQKNAVNTTDTAKDLAIKNNLEQVQSIDFKDGVLTVRANVGAAVALGEDAGTGSDNEKRIPVLFTATKGGKSVVAANANVAKYGGKSGTHTLVWVDLKQGQPNDDKVTVSTNIGLSKEVKVNIVDVSNAPVLKPDAEVAVENGVLTGLVAQKEAVTVAGVKEMYAANGGTIVIETAGGRELKDGEKVATGHVIILKDKDGNKVEEVTVVVKGDVNGTGVMGLSQLLTAAKAVKGSEALEGAYFQAGDLDGNGAIGLNDMLMMAKLLK